MYMRAACFEPAAQRRSQDGRKNEIDSRCSSGWRDYRLYRNGISILSCYGSQSTRSSRRHCLFPLGHRLYVRILVVFFDVFVQKVGNTMLTAMSFATAQILILDVFYVLNGNRAAYPAVLSAIILLASWYAIGKAYDALA